MTVTPSDLTTSEQELAVDQDYAAEAAADLEFGIPEGHPQEVGHADHWCC